MSFGMINPAMQNFARQEVATANAQATGSKLAGKKATGKMDAMGNIIPKGYELGQISQWDPQQMQLFQSLFGPLKPEGFLGRLAGGDEALFNQLEAPAMRQFSSLQGNIASRFGGSGALGGGRKSSGFQNIQNQAASDFAQQLQGQRLNLQRQAYGDLYNYSNALLGQRPYERFLTEKQKKKGGWGGILGATAGGIGGFFLGGPAGAITGAQAGYGIGSSFD